MSVWCFDTVTIKYLKSMNKIVLMEVTSQRAADAEKRYAES